MRSCGQSLNRRLDGIDIVALQGFLDVFDLILYVGFGLGIYLVAQFLEALLGGMNQRIGLVLGLDQFPSLLVLFGVNFCVFFHLVDLFLGQTGRSGNPDRLLFAGTQIFGRDVQNSVGVQIKGYFDLRYAARGRRNVSQFKSTDGLVVRGHLTLTLEHMNGNRRLIVRRRREDLTLFGRHGGIFLYQFGGNTAQRFNAERQWRHVEKQNILDIALQHSALDGCSNGNDLVGVDTFVRGLAKDLFHLGLHHGHPGHTADQNNFIDIGRIQASIF